MKKNIIMFFFCFLSAIFLSGCDENLKRELHPERLIEHTKNIPNQLEENRQFTQNILNPPSKSKQESNVEEENNANENKLDYTLPSIDKSFSSHSKKTSTLNNELKVHYIDVGQGDSTLFEFSDSKKKYYILLDTGNWNGNEVVTYLNKLNVTHIDILIGTHPDADHIGQMEKVLNAFKVDEVWMSGNTNNSQTFKKALNAIKNEKSSYEEPRMGDKYEVGPLKINVLSPYSISEKDNEESLILKFTYGKVKFLFTGDADKDAELNLLQKGTNVSADILHIGHHGSNTSSAPKFVAETNSKIAIYSAGKNNDYGHPHKSTIKTFKDLGINIFGTDVHGDIVITTNGETYTLNKEKEGEVKVGIFK